jgi:hypothetical protein
VFMCVNFKHELIKKSKEQFVAQRDDSSVVKRRTKLLQHFQGYLEFFAVIKNLYKFIPRYAAQTTVLRNSRLHCASLTITFGTEKKV